MIKKICTGIGAILFIQVHVSILVPSNCYGRLVVTGVESFKLEDCYNTVKGLLFYYAKSYASRSRLNASLINL